MERNEISAHEVRVFRALKEAESTWSTANDLAAKAQVAPRTARDKMRKFVSLGLCDIAEVFPAHRYRLSALAGKRNQAYVNRIEQAEKVFSQ